MDDDDYDGHSENAETDVGAFLQSRPSQSTRTHTLTLYK